MYGLPTSKLYPSDIPRSTLNVNKNPLVWVNLPNEEIAHKILKRSILIKGVIDVISIANSYEELLEKVDKDKLFPLLGSGKSFKFDIECVGKKLQTSE